jgi:quinol monooxygenase YgiN
MSVIVTIRITGDPAQAKAVADADPDRIRGISEKGRAAGALHHRFVAGDGEFMVIDEWESAEAFQGFFGSTPEIGAVMAEAGVQSEPHVEIWQPLDMHDEF